MSGVSGNPQVLCVVLLGIDGAGKTTAARSVINALNRQGIDAALFRNPGGRRTLNRWASQYSSTAEALLGARVLDAVETTLRMLAVVRSTLQARRRRGVVIFDRHLACQLALRRVRGLRTGVVLPWLMRFLPQPDLVVYLEVEPRLAHARIATRATDEETLEFLSALDAAYRSIPGFETYTLIDGNGSSVDAANALLGQILSAGAPAISSERGFVAG